MIESSIHTLPLILYLLLAQTVCMRDIRFDRVKCSLI